MQAMKGRELDSMPDNSVPLSPREREVVDLAKRGLSNKAISEALGMTSNTVKMTLANARRKS